MKNVQKNVIFSGVGYILPLIAALATIPIMVKYLGIDLYGLYAICISIVGFMTLVDLGVGQTIVKYVAEYEVTEKRHEIKPLLDIAFLIYVGIGLVTAGLLYVFSAELGQLFYNVPERQALAQSVLHMTAIALFFSYINQFFINICKAYHRFDIPAIIQNVGNLGGIVLSTTLLIMGYSIVEIMIGYIVIYAAGFVFGYFSCLKILPPEVKLGFSFDKAVFEKIISFSFYTFISNFTASLTTRADKLVIGSVIGTEAVTFYQIPYTIAQMANGIIHTLVQIVFPRFSELVGLNDHDRLLSLYKKVTLAMLFISMLIGVALISAGGEFLKVWISPEFAEKATITLQIMAVYFFLNSNIVTSYWLIQSKGNAKLIALISIFGTTIYFIGLNYLGQHFGYNGAAIALFIILVPVPIWFFWVQRHVGHPFIEFLGWLIMTGLVGGLFSYLLLQLNHWLANSYLAIFVDGFIICSLLLVAVVYMKNNHLLSR